MSGGASKLWASWHWEATIKGIRGKVKRRRQGLAQKVQSVHTITNSFSFSIQLSQQSGKQSDKGVIHV